MLKKKKRFKYIWRLVSYYVYWLIMAHFLPNAFENRSPTSSMFIYIFWKFIIPHIFTQVTRDNIFYYHFSKSPRKPNHYSNCEVLWDRHAGLTHKTDCPLHSSRVPTSPPIIHNQCELNIELCLSRCVNANCPNWCLKPFCRFHSWCC